MLSFECPTPMQSKEQTLPVCLCFALVCPAHASLSSWPTTVSLFLQTDFFAVHQVRQSRGHLWVFAFAGCLAQHTPPVIRGSSSQNCQSFTEVLAFSALPKPAAPPHLLSSPPAFLLAPHMGCAMFDFLCLFPHDRATVELSSFVSIILHNIWHRREKCQQLGTGKMAQHLRMLDVSVEYLGLVPSTQIQLLTTTCNYSPMRPDTFSHTWCTDKQVHTHICTK